MNRENRLTFFDLLTVMAAVAGAAVAFDQGRRHGIWGAANGILLGFLVGIPSAIGLRVGGGWVLRRLNLGQATGVRVIYSWVFLLMVLFWIILSAVAGSLVAKTLLHIFLSH
jgi:hypothetical protein